MSNLRFVYDPSKYQILNALLSETPDRGVTYGWDLTKNLSIIGNNHCVENKRTRKGVICNQHPCRILVIYEVELFRFSFSERIDDETQGIPTLVSGTSWLIL